MHALAPRLRRSATTSLALTTLLCTASASAQVAIWEQRRRGEHDQVTAEAAVPGAMGNRPTPSPVPASPHQLRTRARWPESIFLLGRVTELEAPQPGEDLFLYVTQIQR